MALLKVKDFSCIHEARIELSRLTILIGPQGSGKSVLSKLVYFLHEAVTKPALGSFDFIPLEVYKDDLIQEFQRMFPPNAWGDKTFSIELNSGLISCKITRQRPRSVTSIGRLRIAFSDQFSILYKHLQISASTAANAELDEFERIEAMVDSASVRQARRQFRARATEDLQFDLPNFRLYIPAGRAFFSSTGKAAVAFEQAGLLDELTTRFGRIFARVREQKSLRQRPQVEVNRELQTARDELSQYMFGGKLRIGRNDEYVEAKDGRKISFSIMSSGQQEFLPLWMTTDAYLYGFPAGSYLIFIEEPEAHLFPPAQSLLTEYLVALIRSRPQSQMIITTHSPYLLAKINNLIQASRVASMKGKASKVDNILPRFVWLPSKDVSAYCISDGSTKNILSDGLIDADYLDAVSSETSIEFTNLLEIEYLGIE